MRTLYIGKAKYFNQFWNKIKNVYSRALNKPIKELLLSDVLNDFE